MLITSGSAGAGINPLGSFKNRLHLSSSYSDLNYYSGEYISGNYCSKFNYGQVWQLNIEFSKRLFVISSGKTIFTGRAFNYCGYGFLDENQNLFY